MSLASQGLAAMSGDVGLAVPGKGTIWGTTQIRDYLKQTDADMTATRDDVFKFAKASADQAVRNAAKKFIQFYTRWKAWYIDTVDGWMYNSYVETARAYRKRLNEWRKVFKPKGIALTTPDADVEHRKATPWETIAIGAGGVLLGGLVTRWLLKPTPPPARRR